MIKNILFFINSGVAIVLLILFGISFIPPSKVPILPSITLLTPIFIALNILFLLYWLVKLDKKLFVSLFSLLICFSFFTGFFQFGFVKNKISTNKAKLKVLNFNSYGFRGVESGKIFNEKFVDLIKVEEPDIIFLQESELFKGQLSKFKEKLNDYPYRDGIAVQTNYGIIKKTPILSKYPIVNKGIVEGEGKIRKTLYVDIKVNNNKIRCYNVHFTSYRYTKNLEKLKEKGAKNIVSRANTVFKYQEQQLEKIVEHVRTSPYPVIFCGDFNNMAFSYIYRKLKEVGNLKDTFVEAGKGFGATIYFPYFPTRIDFILTQDNIDILSHKVIKTKDWSDHYPVIAEISLPN